MFKLVWTFGFLLNGAPHIQKVPDQSPPTSLEECRAMAATNGPRMPDWYRGTLRAKLDFPIAVYGECAPVLQDATQKVE